MSFILRCEKLMKFSGLRLVLDWFKQKVIDSSTGQYLLNSTSGNYFAKSHILHQFNTDALT